MIDKNYKKSDLEIGKEVAAWYINHEVNKDVYTINEQHAVFPNADLESVKEFAARTKHKVTIVKKDGKILSDGNDEVIEEVIDGPVKKTKKTK